jgi:hypothetical protein
MKSRHADQAVERHLHALALVESSIGWELESKLSAGQMDAATASLRRCVATLWSDPNIVNVISRGELRIDRVEAIGENGKLETVDVNDPVEGRAAVVTFTIVSHALDGPAIEIENVANLTHYAGEWRMFDLRQGNAPSLAMLLTRLFEKYHQERPEKPPAEFFDWLREQMMQRASAASPATSRTGPR